MQNHHQELIYLVHCCVWVTLESLSMPSGYSSSPKLGLQAWLEESGNIGMLTVVLAAALLESEDSSSGAGCDVAAA